MEITYHKSTRGIWIFIDGKHKKTIPAKFESIIASHIDKLDFTRKYLSDTENLLFHKTIKLNKFDSQLSGFLENIKSTEPHLYRLIASAKVTGVRQVYSKYNNRYELCFDNNLKIKCTKTIYHKHPVKLPVAHLNY